MKTIIVQFHILVMLASENAIQGQAFGKKGGGFWVLDNNTTRESLKTMKSG